MHPANRLKQQSIDSLELEVESLRALAAERDALVSTIKSERDASRHALQELTLELEQARAEAGYVMSASSVGGVS
jgi:hypothetical protein